MPTHKISSPIFDIKLFCKFSNCAFRPSMALAFLFIKKSSFKTFIFSAIAINCKKSIQKNKKQNLLMPKQENLSANFCKVFFQKKSKFELKFYFNIIRLINKFQCIFPQNFVKGYVQIKTRETLLFFASYSIITSE